MSSTADLVIIGGGIVGCATALATITRNPGLKVLLLEKETRLAAHQTGHNSGVIHAGLYYRPGSLKAETCASGREALYRFCAEHDIPHERCGKVVVAVDEAELGAHRVPREIGLQRCAAQVHGRQLVTPGEQEGVAEDSALPARTRRRAEVDPGDQPAGGG